MAPPKPDAPANRFPQSSSQHGSEMVTVEVGTGQEMQAFTIHKNLLSQASEYFDRALNGNFIESYGLIRLPRHAPEAFELVYQWLYTGQKSHPKNLLQRDPRFPSLTQYKNTFITPLDRFMIFWTHLFKLADETMVDEIKLFAYESLIAEISPSTKVLGWEIDSHLLQLAWGTETPQPVLQDLFAYMGAYILLQSNTFHIDGWRKSFKNYPGFAAMVLDRVAVQACKRTNGQSMTHRSVEYAVEKVFGKSSTAEASHD
jgi:hypothetical protein